MFELVKTRRQQRKFADTWEYFCVKYGWYNDPYAADGNRYNLLHKRNFYRRPKVIGTIEIIPYDPNNPNSTVEGEGRFKFSQFDELRMQQHRTWEIDKLCIHHHFQRKGYFGVFSHILIEHANKNDVKYYLGLVEKKLYRMLKISFNSFIEQKGDALVGPTTALVPTVLHIGSFLEDEEAVHKLFKTIRSRPI